MLPLVPTLPKGTFSSLPRIHLVPRGNAYRRQVATDSPSPGCESRAEISVGVTSVTTSAFPPASAVATQVAPTELPCSHFSFPRDPRAVSLRLRKFTLSHLGMHAGGKWRRPGLSFHAGTSEPEQCALADHEESTGVQSRELNTRLVL